MAEAQREDPASTEPRPTEAARPAAARPGGIVGGMIYGATLPERLVRGMVGAASGVLRETAVVVVPDGLKGTKLYEIAVQKMLGMLIEDVGGLKLDPASRAAGGSSDGLMARKAVANVVDAAGLATIHLSPLWIFAIVSDAAYGARTYLQALVKELKAEGIIEKSAAVESVDDLLGSLQKLSGVVADRLDAPPLTLDELKRSVEQLRTEAAKVDVRRVIPAEEMERVWSEIRETAAREGASVFQVSSAMAMMALNGMVLAGRGAYGGIKVGFNLFDDNILQYYGSSLARIHEKGYWQALAETYEPYLRSLRHLFEPSTATYTEEVLTGRLFRRPLRWIKGLFGCGTKRAACQEASDPAHSSGSAPSGSGLSPPSTGG